VGSVRRSLLCSFRSPLLPAILAVMADYRLMVNRGLREALASHKTALGSLTNFSQLLAREYRIGGAHARTAMETSLALAAGHRRRLRKGQPSSVPYCRRLFLNADDQTFHLDPQTGHVRLSLRNGEWAGLDLVLSMYHRTVLASARLKQLRLRPDRAILVLERDVPDPFVPRAILALDTNERSFDGVLASAAKTTAVTFPYPEVATIQHRYFVRRRRIGRKKANDRRTGKRLGRREGQREHHRVVQRLHVLTKGMLTLARRRRAALVLEDLHLPRGGGRRRRMRRRLSSWPQRELHRQLEYKAAELGVPVMKVNPAYTSKTCSNCGVRKDRRSRVGRVFVCANCHHKIDRQLNAGLNIGRTALAELPEGAMRSGLGDLWLDPDALARDAMKLLYAPGHTGAHGRSGRSGSGRSARSART
jgi:IS605 OrfB family transposase